MNDPLDQLRLRFTGLRLLTDTGHGQVYAGQDFTGAEVTVAVLSEQAAADAGMRGVFGDTVWRHSPGAAPEVSVVYAADLHAARPWAAIRNAAGQPGAEQLLAPLGGAATALAAPPPPPALYPASPAAPPPPPPPPAVPAGFGAPAPGSPPPWPAGTGYPPPPGHPGAGNPPGAGYAPPAGGAGYAPPAGYPPPAPSRPRSPWPLLIGVAASVVGLIVVAGVAIVGVQVLRGGGQDDPPLVANPPQPPPAQPPPPGTEPPELPSSEPRLRDVDPISVLGPTWERGEETYTMEFGGWPFAFRTPSTWGCIGGSFTPIPQARVWQCTDEQNPGSGQRMNVMLWECPTSCTPEEQDDMIEAWLDHPEDAVRHEDLPVAYVEYETNDRGNYAVDLSHFGGVGGPLRWHVGVYVESPPDTADDVLKILNDIISQSA